MGLKEKSRGIHVTEVEERKDEGTVGKFHESRHFNQVWVVEGVVMKWSRDASIRGELYFYRNLPRELSGLFPRFYGFEEEKGGLRLIMERLWGDSGAQRLVTGRFDIPDLDTVLQSLRHMHRTRAPYNKTVKPNMYANYAPKLQTRWAHSRDIFERAGITNDTMQRVLTLLHRYEAKHCGTWSDIIHGDAVLTNVLLPPNNTHQQCIWIDPRGMQGNLQCLGGDAMYDYAKVTQSLLGYSWFVSGCHSTWTRYDAQRVERLVRRVRLEVERMHGGWWGCMAVVCGLVTSLIPLHQAHRRSFAAMACALVECLEGGGLEVEVVVDAVARVLAEGSGEGRTVDYLG